MKKSIIPVLLLLPSLLAGCTTPQKKDEGDDEQPYVPQDISARDVSYPTEIPPSKEATFQIHYRRSTNKYAEWGLWLWDPAGDDDGVVDVFNYQDDFGVTACYPLSYVGECSDNRFGFIIRKLDGWTKDCGDADHFVDLTSVVPDNNNCRHIYMFSGDATMYSNPNKAKPDAFVKCEFENIETINVVTTNKVVDYYLIIDGVVKVEGYGVMSKSFKIDLPKSDPKANIEKTYVVKVEFLKSGAKLTKPVSVANLYNTSDFNKNYTYDGELGAIYTPTKTTFKVWSPVSSSIKVRIYENGTPKYVSASLGSDEYAEHTLVRGEKGVFSLDVEGDLEGKYYTFVVTNGVFTNQEIVDPYAKSAGIHGSRGQIVDFSKTNPAGWDNVSPIAYDRNELTVWETHVRDLTSHETWNGSEANRKKYLGMIEEGTTYTKNGVTVKTGFDHIKELGVNAVQILPIFDQANDELSDTFNWGYNPLNYNVLEGMYSSNPYDGYARIREFKQVVKAFNEAGINIIMDVVYNHVNGADRSNFDVLMPGYYYRYTADGSLSNGSGCGNETASEMPMMRKFMIDSTEFLAKEYKLGGFRFDLMGLHDITTMNNLTAKCKEVNPNIVIYGEPWTGGTSSMKNFEQNSAKQSNGNKYVGYGAFNDVMRDALIKGGLNAASATGWVTDPNTANKTDVNAIVKGIAGITAASNEINDPNKTVNYVTCHDNYTLIDRVKLAAASTIESRTDFEKMCVLANSIVFTSQGTSFMLAGEEFLRSKGGNDNSYNASDNVNNYHYDLKVQNIRVFNVYKELIKFKQQVADLHASTAKINVTTLEDGKVLKYTVMDGNTEYVVIHSNGGSDTSINLSGYNVYLDTLSKLQPGTALGTSFKPSRLQTLIAVKA